MFKKYKGLIIKLIISIIIAISIVMIYAFVEPIRAVTNLLIISIVIAYTLKPLRNYFCEKLHISYKKSSLLIILLLLLSFVGLIYCIVPTMLNESGNFGVMLDSIEEYILSLAARFKLDRLPIFETIYIQIGEKINMILSNTSTHLVDNLIDMGENLVTLAIVPITTYYFLADSKLIYNKLLLVLPTDKRVIVKNINKNIDKILSRYILSQLLLCLIIGVLSFILLLILRVKFPLVLSIINAVANIIPYFGPIIGGVPIIFIALTGSVTKGIIAAIGVILIQQVEGNFLAPKITGDSTNMHPIIIIILLVLGDKIGGVIGMVLIVPIAVIIKVIYDDIDYYLF
ncbi:AI-2E family transporter [Clostridium disporicum]|uniref:AI-2E family transporter n=1 Tax=Clostridium disporicum TaxID=84024 RepID=UPI0006C3C79B|nr:AI-2E family transporter [Clostridium disporicum]CUN48546.1 permease [Clostridium disporicum]